MKKKLLSVLLASCMVLSLAACGASSETPASNGTDNAQQTTDSTDSTGSDETATDSAAAGTNTGVINVCLASEPATLDPALNSAVDGATMINHLFSGLAKWGLDANGNLELQPDCAEELVEGVENEDGTVTYTYTLKDGLTWSDGQPVTAGDFVFAWNRAAGQALAADYGYMFEVVDGYADIWAEDAKGDETLNVKAIDDKTLEVTLVNQVAYWNELLAFPTYMPVREDVVSNESWATDPSTYVNNGAYVMSSWEHNSVITLTKNDKFVDADKVTMNEINFYLSDDANNQLANFENGDWEFIDDVPTNEIASLKDKYPTQFVTAGQLGTYYVCWNINEEILPSSSTLTGVEKANAENEIRNALALLIDRNYIVNDIAQGGQVPASSFVAMGLTDADGSQFYQNAGPDKSITGYYDVTDAAYEDNWTAALETLKKYYTFDESTQQFTDFPTLTYLYNTSEGHKAIGEAIQSTFAGIGITMNLENQEWATFLDTRKAGNYSIARNGWLGDYNDPISFLDMWTTASGNNDVQFGKGDNADVKAYSLDITDLGYDTKVENGTWAETYDVLIGDIKTCTDTNTRYELMHRAEDLLMSTGCICPIYYYTDLYMISDKVSGFFSSPLGYKYFMYCSVAE
ncbi:oligopeptide transport system substrate-binding protein [Butyrivibrio hungatei DSM 14810]|uniref:Oligopeptide transport system substrate-binding protein n=1 Tax=Butyrivibrio hungatei DSM 14810 TaxID=1121132 RepID=A0A1M7S6H8_9FIRM|nr:peptide ABC transporter substrate-binding protein [Butyrivibrio hungatei]SHN54066.1 oligopeptide transport system substrate-binding protein [Butyrivibrio hungatei DSM 14810]